MFTKKLTCFSILCLFITIFQVKGIQPSKQEEIDFDAQFQHLQKSSAKTIQNEYGEIYDCVDFYSQPAFDHPQLRNHTFHPQMRPSFAPHEENLSWDDAIASVKLKGQGCPMGTVPIKRVTKDDAIQIKRFTEDYASRVNFNTRKAKPGTHFAIVQTNSDPSKVKYYGVGGVLNIYNLSITPSEYSTGQLIIQSGDDSIQVGWTINPTINKDSSPHLFQYLNAGQSHCFNMFCPGFVSVSKDIPIDTILEGMSKRGGDQYVIKLLIYQDVKKGNWWLQFLGTIIGFWPQQIFTSMATSATYIGAGGEAYAPLNLPFPPMGNGYYPVQDLDRSAYCSGFVALDSNRNQIDPKETKTYVDDWHYGVYDVGNSTMFGRVVYYGGTTL